MWCGYIALFSSKYQRTFPSNNCNSWLRNYVEKPVHKICRYMSHVWNENFESWNAKCQKKLVGIQYVKYTYVIHTVYYY